MSFHVGQKVVCVRNEPVGQERKYATGEMSQAIFVGKIYTVREIDFRAIHLHGVACVRLKEVVWSVRPSTVGPWESGYPAPCFRPLTERKKDGEAFVEKLKSTCTPNDLEKLREDA